MNFKALFTKIKLNATTPTIHPDNGNGKGNKIVVKKKRHTPNTEIYVEATHRRIFRYLDKKRIPRDSYEKSKGGIPWHILGLDLAGKLWSINVPPQVVEGESPSDLFMAKHCAEEVEEVYGLSMPAIEKIKLGIFIVIIIAIIFVTFMIVMSATGNNPEQIIPK